MTTSAQQHNLQELIVALQGIKDGKGDAHLTKELRDLIEQGLHHAFLPDTLRPAAAEMFQLTAEGVGGLPRMMLWADRNYGAFMKLYARQTIPTIAPVIPPAPTSDNHDEWPEWMTARRLAYQLTPPDRETSEEDE